MSDAKRKINTACCISNKAWTEKLKIFQGAATCVKLDFPTKWAEKNTSGHFELTSHVFWLRLMTKFTNDSSAVCR